MAIDLKNGKKRSIQPEIQFVLPKNKNEVGFSSHQVYDLKKVISANARLFGALTVSNLKFLLKEVSTGFDPRTMLQHLLYPQSGSTKPFLYILKAKSKHSRKEKFYITTSDVFSQ